MHVLIDDREKLPWGFSQGVQVTRRRLAAGDYSLDGFESLVSIERKSLDDFASTVTRGRKRFHAELARLAAYRDSRGLVAVIIEGTPIDLALGRYKTQVNPARMFAAVAAVQVDWRIPVLFGGNRGGSIMLCEALFERWIRRVEKNR